MVLDNAIKRRKKLIEVAIPLEAINEASAREKSIRHGHPSTLHLWWARRPLAAARAVIFCQLVDDPSAVPEEFPSKEDQEKERLKLFALISELVQWKNTMNKQIFDRAQKEIRKSWERCCSDNANHPHSTKLFNPKKLPDFHDPFAGGGALPLEAQRLGLETFASDLNPVAVIINKAMTEIPSTFSGYSPVHPTTGNKIELLANQWKGPEGIAEDVYYYGKWMREEAKKRIEYLYPKVLITHEIISKRPDLKSYQGKELKVIAWIWTRTVKSPNPAFSEVEVPLASSFILSSKKGQEYYIQPSTKGDSYTFEVKTGRPENYEESKKGTKLARGANFKCLMSGMPIDSKYIKSQGKAQKMGKRLMAIVVEGARNRIYLSPIKEHEDTSLQCGPSWEPLTPIGNDKRALWTPPYGLKTFGDLFTKRQLIALNTFSDLITEAQKKVINESIKSGLSNTNDPLYKGGNEAKAYAEAINVYLGFVIDKCSDYWSSICSWSHTRQTIRCTFGRQAIPMSWDFAEVNPFSSSTGNWMGMLDWVYKSIKKFPLSSKGIALQANASTQSISHNKIISTDPPYYDNIGYADLSDFFYVWLRKSQKASFPELFSTISTPKIDEIVAIPYRHDNKEKAEDFFLNGMTEAMHRLASLANQCFPITIYYAFKQSETKDKKGTASTGWETFLTAVLKSGLSITGTWPIRTELSNRLISSGANALASSIVLVCQIRNVSAKVISRNDFRRELRLRLPNSIHELEKSNIAPVDVAQAVIGPGMAIFSQAKSVIKPDDTSMSVREALIEINNTLDECLSKNEGALDGESRFALLFFESYGYEEQPYGKAEGLSKALNISVEGVANAGIIYAVGGKTKLLKREELESEWSPLSDNRLCVWEATQYLIRILETKGEQAAGSLLHQLHQVNGTDDLPANCRSLAYRLYNYCEKTNQTEEARAYNNLIIAWPELQNLALANQSDSFSPIQAKLL